MSCEPISPAQRATNAMKSTSKSIVGVVEMYEKMSNKQLFTDLEEELSSLEHAKLDVSMAYALATLYYILLNTKGVDACSMPHPVREEIDRLKGYVLKLQNFSSGSHDSSVQSRLRIDAAAAKRIVDHNTSLGKRKLNDVR